MSERERQLEEALRKAYAVIQALKTRGEREEEPIAVIGTACRLPGAPSTEEFWDLLQTGRSAIRPCPEERKRLISPRIPLPENWRGGFLDDVDQFAAEFFGISDDDARRMSPLHRMLLEICWSAMENAGIAPAALRNSATGVFMGMGEDDYLHATGQLDDAAQIDDKSLTGNVADYALGRLTFQLGLRGPAMALSTGCSSALVAVHLACASLRRHECDLAFAGGAQCNLLPYGDLAISRLNVLAKDGCSRSFSESANGFVRGEGIGMVVLKPLAAARRDGDPILGVIRASAMNNNGPRSGYTAPNGLAEKELVRQVLQQAGASASTLGYVEAHATGTRFGDAVEVNALIDALAECAIDHSVVLGSVKPVIGHLEAASGIAGLVKALQVLRHRHIPASLFAEPLNQLVDWSRGTVRVATSDCDLPNETNSALVCAFGMSGTNACLLVENAASIPATEITEHEPQVLPISANTPQELDTLVAAFRQRLDGEGTLGNIALTLATGRQHYPYRLACVATDNAQAKRLLSAYLEGQTHPAVCSHVDGGKLAFLATGQGAQYAGMGEELYRCEPVFRAIIDTCDACYTDCHGRSLRELMFGITADAETAIHETQYAQPALYAYACAQAALWQSWGITPDVVMGHSLGEYVAAQLAGVFSLEDGLRLTAARGALMQRLPRVGAMLAVMASETAAQAWLHDVSGVLTLAAINGPESLVLTGDVLSIDACAQRLADMGIKHRRLQVSHAFHSPLIEPALQDFQAVLEKVTYHTPTIPVVSNVDGSTDADIANPHYWLTHARNPVRFADGMQALADAGCRTFLEIGPSATLIGMGQKCLGAGCQWLASARAEMPAYTIIRQSQAALYAAGYDLAWGKIYAGKGRHHVSLPGYPLPRKHYWFSDECSTQDAADLSPTGGSIEQTAALSACELLQKFIVEVTDGAIQPVKSDDAFFSLGLNSLQWMQIHNRLQECYTEEIPVTLVFIYPTIGELAEYLDNEFANSRV